MLLKYSLEDNENAIRIERAVTIVLEKGIRTADIAAGEPFVSTHEMGEAILSALN
jgi:3-isopropylmalate dehydrogenase